MRVVYSPTQTLHHSLELDGGQLILSWESPIRAVRVAEQLIKSHQLIEPDPLDRDLLQDVHDPDYIEFLSQCWDRWVAAGRGATQAMAFTWPALGMRDVRPETLDGQLGYHSFAADCSIGPDTWGSAAASAAAAHTAARLVAEGARGDSNDAEGGDTNDGERDGEPGPSVPGDESGGDRIAFALCRPPGHHAGARQFGGYCYLNNAAIAAQALRNRGFGRVAVIDIDYHHGNGTQSIFYERSDVSVASIHADPRYEFPYFSGYPDETGEGKGEGANLNLPLPLETGPSDWMANLDEAVRWLEHRHEPEALVVSAGFDTFEGDPISSFKLPTATYPTIGSRLASMGLPTVLVMEGGYANDALADNVGAFLDGFAER